MWQSFLKGFETHITLEKGLSENTLAAYVHDIDKLRQFLEIQGWQLHPKEVNRETIRKFLTWITDLGFTANSQARILSGIKAFFAYLIEEEIIVENPLKHIDAPKLTRKLPTVLSIQEMDAIINAVDRSTPEGERNRTILELLYSCGLRVSELINLEAGNVFWEDEIVRVIGKGDKERLVPIGSVAIKQLKLFINTIRRHESP
ncbi:MAG: site-specific integrase, partial [Bacteroidetes bacterium]|nr:site-specific integrase [Bacteroidota bacterium]